MHHGHRGDGRPCIVAYIRQMQRIVDVGYMASSITATQTKHSFRPTSLFQSGWRPTDSSSIDPSLSFCGAPPSGVAVYLTTAHSRLMILKSDKLTPTQPWSQL